MKHFLDTELLEFTQASLSDSSLAAEIDYCYQILHAFHYAMIGNMNHFGIYNEFEIYTGMVIKLIKDKQNKKQKKKEVNRKIYSLSADIKEQILNAFSKGLPIEDTELFSQARSNTNPIPDSE